jgi:DNA-binding NarL/FixJ family response regulator
MAQPVGCSDYIGLRLRVAMRSVPAYTAESRAMNHLTREDYALAMRLLANLEGQARQPEHFARACAQAMRAYLPSVSVKFDSRRARLRVERSGAINGGDRQRMELLRPHLAFLYRQACERNAPEALQDDADMLTPREREVMSWLSCGKTDVDIAQLLQISPRTVHKHLEHIYVKLGVETRTAAVMRVHRLA